MFKAGDEVVCINDSSTSLVVVGSTYKVAFDQCNAYVHLVDFSGGMYADRFKLKEPEPVIVVDELVDVAPEMPMLTIQLGKGLGIVLDPNVPFSRKFAEAFLDVVYGKVVN